jgi:hypothetical protein
MTNINKFCSESTDFGKSKTRICRGRRARSTAKVL